MKQFIKFTFAGIFNSVFGYGIIFFCMFTVGLGAITSNIIGYACGIVTSYGLNKFFTFNSKANVVTTAGRFVLVFVIAYLANLTVLFALIHYLTIYESLAQVLAGVVYVAISFLMNKYFVFNYSSLSSSLSGNPERC